MQISALNKTQSFSSNTPIYHVYVRNKDGTTSELPSYKVKGPALALVKRLNDTNTRESQFIKNYIADYNSYPFATSSIWGKNSLDKKHIIYGEDAVQTNTIRTESFRFDNITQEDAKDRIKRSIIDPLAKKVRLPRFDGDKTGEQVGLVLYTDQIRPNYYKLNGLQITSIDGRVYATLAAIPNNKSSKMNVNNDNENKNKNKNENININNNQQQTSAEQTSQNKDSEEGYLFDVEEFTDHPNRWQIENELKPRKRWRKHK